MAEDQDHQEAAMSPAPAIDQFLDAIKTATIPACDAWSADATLDATVPNWRLHASGADAIRAEYSRWFVDPGQFGEFRRFPVQADGGPSEIVEYTLSWTENGVPHAAHHMHLLTVREDRIVADTVMCGGRWPASLLAEMEAADA
jgi:hypothetical protein